MESLSNSKFKQLNANEMQQLTGGAILPKKGTEVLASRPVVMPSGETYTPAVAWRTGWFSSTRVYGDAVQIADSN